MSSKPADAETVHGTPLRALLDLDDSAFDALPIGVYACDARGRIVRANRKACELWGRTPELNSDSETFCGSYRLFTLDGEPIAREQIPMARALREGEAFSGLEAQVENPDGRRWIGSVNISLLRGEDGAIVGALNCFQDVTQAHAQRAEAERANAYLRKLVEATPECIKVVGRDGSLLEMNSAGLCMVGADGFEQVRGASTFELIATEDREQWIANHRRVCNGERIDWEFDVIGLKGARRHMKTHAVPLELPDGTIAHLAVTRDMTEAKEAETALAKRARQQAALYKFTDRLYRSSGNQDVLEAGLDAITEALDCDRASILLYDDHGDMRFVAWRGLSDKYRKAVAGHSPWKPDETDPRPIWVRDIEKTDEPVAIVRAVRAEDIRGLAFIPLLIDDRLAGKFMVYYRDLHDFAEEEIDLAVTISRHLGFSIEQRQAETGRDLAEEMLRDRERQLSSMFQNAAVGMVLMKRDYSIVSANPEFCRISGRSFGDLLGASCFDFTFAGDQQRSRDAAEELLTGSTSVSFEKRLVLPDGKTRWTRVNLNQVDEEKILAVVEDVDAQRRAEDQERLLLEERALTEEKFRVQAEEFHTLADNIPTLCWMAYADGHIYWFNQRWYAYTGTTPAMQEGWGWHSVHDPEVLPQVVERWNHSLATGEPFEMTFPIKGADGEFRPFLTRVVPIRDEAGRVKRWFGTNTDVTAQARHQEHLQLLINELNHRVKNTLSTVQSLSMRSLKNAPSLSAGLDAFEGRLLALSRAHNLLTVSNWEGAELQELVRSALEPFAVADSDKISIEGPKVWLHQRDALALAMVFHELATNATKYGALGRDAGTLAIKWSLPGRNGHAHRMRLEWTEHGVTGLRPPERRGFGSQLIERTVMMELKGELAVTYGRSGVRCRIEVPLEHSGPDDATPNTGGQVPPFKSRAAQTLPG